MTTTPRFNAHYDESKVPPYDLPPLFAPCGESTREQWETSRRTELLHLFREQVYGEQPPALPFRAEVRESGPALAGLGVREQVRLTFEKDGRSAFIDLLIYRPATASAPAPVFLGMNFHGNPSTTPDPAVLPSASWARGTPEQQERGAAASRWPYELALQRGYAVATFYYGDAAPDDTQRWRDGLAQIAFPDRNGLPGATEPGAIAWWAWGLSRCLDFLASRPETFDAGQVTVFGHSRQGKTALWAAAEDERFAVSISNNSGCTGAALARRGFGETIEIINNGFPYWFCGNYKQYNHREGSLPVDQHQLAALIAPRPLYIASASEDLWADPKGEYLAGVEAEPIYRLYGYGRGLEPHPPATGVSVGNRIGYHRREGKHDITVFDWEHFLSFAERHR